MAAKIAELGITMSIRSLISELAKGGPGSGPHPSEIAGVKTRIAESVQRRADLESARALDHRADHLDAEKAHLAAVKAHNDAAKAQKEAGNNPKAWEHKLAAGAAKEKAVYHREKHEHNYAVQHGLPG